DRSDGVCSSKWLEVGHAWWRDLRAPTTSASAGPCRRILHHQPTGQQQPPFVALPSKPLQADTDAAAMTFPRLLLWCLSVLCTLGSPAVSEGGSVDNSRDGRVPRLEVEGDAAGRAWRFGKALRARLETLSASANGR